MFHRPPRYRPRTTGSKKGRGFTVTPLKRSRHVAQSEVLHPGYQWLGSRRLVFKTIDAAANGIGFRRIEADLSSR
ncbi:hypothetical protein B224_p00025 (plasmid) [Aeromonas media WS]|nr:hypothetical protein B224_p00025 [Aeromonas media WS]